MTESQEDRQNWLQTDVPRNRRTPKIRQHQGTREAIKSQKGIESSNDQRTM